MRLIHIVFLILSLLILTLLLSCDKGPTAADIEELILEPERLILNNWQDQQFTCTMILKNRDQEDVTEKASYNVFPGNAGGMSAGVRGLFYADESERGMETITATYKSHSAKATVVVTLPEQDNMVFVPAFYVMIGNDNGDTNEKPAHRTYISDFWIDKYEVTNTEYVNFLSEVLASDDASGNASYISMADHALIRFTNSKISYINEIFNIETDKENHPVTGVTWYGAKAYAEHYGKRLPTEAEWEKAARGVDERTYPWGEEAPTHLYCNFNNQNQGTVSAGYYNPLGNSPYGCCDMAGNVNEWCHDWYQSDYYSEEFIMNPQGPPTGEDKVLRGGAWPSSAHNIRSTERGGASPNESRNDHGFRCVKAHN